MPINRIKRAIREPLFAAYAIRAYFDHAGLMKRYKLLAERAGLDQVYLVLSFDCDTAEDIAAVWDVHSRLTDIGVNPVYAVPGELLQQGEHVYRRVFESGGEFLNHGYKQHTYFDEEEGRHASCFFYDQLTRDVVREDIERGHECLEETIGATARGFRTPHFGTFRSPDQLRFLHSVLGNLGYRFSTSTDPFYGFRFGPIFDDFGIDEVPVTGMASRPLTILDSWTCFEAPNRTLSPADYHDQGLRVADIYSNLGVGLLNFYADPSHVHSSDAFFRTVDKWLGVAKSIHFETLFR